MKNNVIIKSRILLMFLLVIVSSITTGCSVNLVEQPPSMSVGNNNGELNVEPYVGCWEHGFIVTEVYCGDMQIDQNEIIGSRKVLTVPLSLSVNFTSGPEPDFIKYEIFEIESGKLSKLLLSGKIQHFPQSIDVSVAAGKNIYVDMLAKWGRWGDAYYVFTATVAP